MLVMHEKGACRAGNLISQTSARPGSLLLVFAFLHATLPASFFLSFRYVYGFLRESLPYRNSCSRKPFVRALRTNARTRLIESLEIRDIFECCSFWVEKLIRRTETDEAKHKNA